MSHYLLEIAYTPEAWAAQLEDPKDRTEVIRPVLESVGARFECLYYAFGDRDIVGIIEAPDNVSVAAISIGSPIRRRGVWRSMIVRRSSLVSTLAGW